MAVDQYGNEVTDPSQDPNNTSFVNPLTGTANPLGSQSPFTANGQNPNALTSPFTASGTNASASSQFPLGTPSGGTGATLNGATGQLTAPGYITSPTGSQLSTNQQYIQQVVSTWANAPGADPSLQSDPTYWVNTIIANGGLGPSNIAYWQNKAMTAYLGQNTTGTNTTQTPFTSIAGLSTPGTGSTSSDPAQNALFATLMAQATAPLNTDPNQPVIKGQTDAYNAAETQAQRQYLQSLAEQAGPNANISAETRNSYQTVGQADAAFQATAILNELTAQRTQIQNALQGAEGLLTAEQSNQLQLQLAQITAAIDQAQLQQQAFQFDTNQNNAAGGIPTHS